MDASPPGAMLSQLLAQWPWAEPLLLVVHLLSVACVIGSVVAFDLRLVGFAQTQSVRALSRLLISVALLALLPATLSGALLFAIHAQTLIGSAVFFWKMVALFALSINAMIFATGSYQRVAHWEMGAPPLSARVAGSVSMVLLVVVVTLGARLATALAHLS